MGIVGQRGIGMDVTTEVSAPSGLGQEPVKVPDHELLRVIGRGSYGEVWEARNVMGTPRAVKIVRRFDFQSERPFEREFEGIQRYEPVSRSHSGLMQVLHVGLSPGRDYFYYVMELADADRFAPEGGCAYSPRTLRGELDRRGALSVLECIEIGMTLATALGHLHRNGLVHRDVKPSNIIFVADTPKLADVGLVTRMGDTGSLVGTEGYFAPEGTSQPRSDVFALGKVLYECVTGIDRTRFPDVPEEWGDDSQGRASFEFMEIVLRAAELNPERRYKNVEEVLADLALLQAGKSVRHIRRVEKHLKRTLRGLGIAAVALTLIGGAWLYERHQRGKVEQAEQIARRASEETRQLLGASLIAEARAVRMSGQAGAREMAIQAVLRGVTAQADPVQLRSEAASALALIDVGDFSPAMPQNRSGLTQAAWSEDGTTLVSVEPDGATQVFTRNGLNTNLRATVQVPARARIAAVSRRADWLALIDENGALIVLHLSEQGPAWKAENSGPVLAMAFSHDGDWLVVSAPEGLIAYRSDGTERVALVPGAPPARRILISPDGNWIATLAEDPEDLGFHLYFGLPGRMPGGDDPGRIIESEIASEIRLTGPSISGDSKYLAAAVSEDRVRVWEIGSLTQIATLRGHQRSVRGTAFHPKDSSILASTSWDGTTRLWNIPARKEILVAPTGGDDLLLLPERGELLLRTWDHSAVKSAPLSADNGLRVLVPPAGQLSGLFSAVSFSPDGRLLAAAGDAGVIVWDLQTGRTWQLQESGLRVWLDASFSPDGRYLWCSGKPGLRRHAITVKPDGGEVEFSPGEVVDERPAGHLGWVGTTQSLAVCYRFGEDGGIRLYGPDGVESGLLRQPFCPDRVASSADGRWLAAPRYPESGGLLWDLGTNPPQSYPVDASSRCSLGFLNHLPLLVIGTDRDIRFQPLPDAGGKGSPERSVSEPPVLARQHAEFVPGRHVESVSSNLVAFTTSPTSVTLCDAKTLKTIAVLDSPLTCFDAVLAFSPDGSRLALAGGVNRVVVWETDWIRQELIQRGLGW